MNKNRTHRDRTRATRRPEHPASSETKTVNIPIDQYAKFVFCETYVKSIIKVINDDGYFSVNNNNFLIEMLGEY